MRVESGSERGDDEGGSLPCLFLLEEHIPGLQNRKQEINKIENWWKGTG